MVCLEAGLGLAEALRLVGRESERHGGVLGAEFATTAGEVTAGVSLSDSLRNLGARVGTEELKSITAILVQSHQMGSRLGPALRASADQLATGRRMQAKEMAQKSAIKMLIPLVVFILPAMMMVVLGPAIIQTDEGTRWSLAIPANRVPTPAPEHVSRRSVSDSRRCG
jgi:tight adherence protein C